MPAEYIVLSQSFLARRLSSSCCLNRNVTSYKNVEMFKCKIVSSY